MWLAPPRRSARRIAMKSRSSARRAAPAASRSSGGGGDRAAAGACHISCDAPALRAQRSAGQGGGSGREGWPQDCVYAPVGGRWVRGGRGGLPRACFGFAGGLAEAPPCAAWAALRGDGFWHQAARRSHQYCEVTSRRAVRNSWNAAALSPPTKPRQAAPAQAGALCNTRGGVGLSTCAGPSAPPAPRPPAAGLAPPVQQRPPCLRRSSCAALLLAMDTSNSLPAGSLFGIPIRLSYSECGLQP